MRRPPSPEPRRSRPGLVASAATRASGALREGVDRAVAWLDERARGRERLAAERFLAEASRQLSLSIDLDATLARVARLAVPTLGDWCLVVVLGPQGRPRSVAAEAADPARKAAARELLERYPIDLSARHGVGRILRSGDPELIPEADPESFVGDAGAVADVRRELLRRLGLRSYIGTPLATGGRILGAIAFGVAAGPRRLGRRDLQLAEELAHRCAVALENASLYQDAVEARRAREEVLAVVSHDLKTPLGALLLGAQNLARIALPGPEGEEVRRAAHAVRRTAERVGRLVHDLVDFGALEAGRLAIRPGAADAPGIAREAVEGFAELARERGVALAVEAPASQLATCDRDRILQVLGNLLANALHAVEPGGRVVLRVEADADGGAVFTVTDTGSGIPEDELPRVFERWYRGRRAAYPGSGLGLAIVRGIVEAHGGEVWVRSTPGQGSAFSFSVPGPMVAR